MESCHSDFHEGNILEAEKTRRHSDEYFKIGIEFGLRNV